MRTITIGGITYDLELTTQAYYKICDMCGSIQKLKSWLTAGAVHDKLRQLIEALVDGAERRKKYYDSEYKIIKPIFPRFFKSGEIAEIYISVFSEMENAMYHEIPENVETKSTPPDIDLEEIKEERAAKKGIKRPNKALPIIAKGLACGIDYNTLMNAMTPGEVLQIWLYQIEARGGTGNGQKK